MRKKSGEGCIEICILVIAFSIILSVMITFVTTVGVIKQTKRNTRLVLDSFIMKNTVSIYDSVKNGNDYTESIDNEGYIDRLCSFVVLVKENGILCKYDENGEKQYWLTEPELNFTEEKSMKIKVGYTITVPMFFAGIRVSYVNIPIEVVSTYNNKF